MHRSDWDSQYYSSAYRALQDGFGIQTSMMSQSNCWYNVPMERFFGIIKTESPHHYRFKIRVTAISGYF